MRTENLTLDARTEQLDTAIQFIDAELAKISCPQEIAWQIELAVEEVFMNVANYAFNETPGKINIFMKNMEKACRTTIIISISDNGKPFNPLLQPAPDTTIPLEERDIGGMGIFLVKKVMNTVTYSYQDGCNRLEMSKSW